MPPELEPGSSGTEPITEANAPSATLDIVKDLMGEPPAPQPPEEPPAPQPPEEPPPAPAGSPPQPPTEPSPQPPRAPGEPPDVPESLLDKPQTPPAGDDFDPNDIKIEEIDEKLRPNFAKMRDKLNAIQRDLEVAVKERDSLKESKSSEITETEIYKQLKAKNDELMDLIARTNLSADPRFKAKYENMRAPIEESIKAAIASYNVSELNADDVVAFAQGLSPKDRADWLAGQFPEELQASAVASLLPMFAQIDIVQRSMQAELASHKESKAVLEQQNREKLNEQLVALREEAKTSALRDLSQTEFLLQRVQGVDEWNKTVDELNAKISETFNSKDPGIHARALVLSELAPAYKSLYYRERIKRLAYENAIKARNIALPEIGKSSAPPPAQPKKIENMTIDEAVKLSTPPGLR